jgi:hypothetical protein
MIQLISDSREPVFASNEQRKGRFVMYYDNDGEIACCNFAAHPNFRKCVICKNCCVQFMAHDDGTYTCSACGKFPRELLQQ